MPLVTGIHQNYTLGIEKLSHHAKKISNKGLYVILAAVVWKYFELNDSRVIFWWLSFSIHFVFLRFLIHLHPLVFYFLTRIPAKYRKIVGSLFLAAYFGGAIASYKLRMEILFHHFRIGLVLLSVVLLKPFLLNLCESHDAKVMKYDLEAQQSKDGKTAEDTNGGKNESTKSEKKTSKKKAD